MYRGCINCGWYEAVSTITKMIVPIDCPNCGSISVGGFDEQQFKNCIPKEEDNGKQTT